MNQTRPEFLCSLAASFGPRLALLSSPPPDDHALPSVNVQRAEDAVERERARRAQRMLVALAGHAAAGTTPPVLQAMCSRVEALHHAAVVTRTVVRFGSRLQVECQPLTPKHHGATTEAMWELLND